MRRIFPNATGMDVLKMQRWTCLRKARNVLTSPEFGASSEEFRQVFSLLEEGCSGIITATDLLRAQILSRIEVLAVLPATVEWDLSLDDFNRNVTPVLIQKYVTEMGRCRVNSGVEAATWEEGLVHDEIKKQFQAAKRQHEFPFTSPDKVEHPSLPRAALAKVTSPRDSARPIAAAPLPHGLVAELVRRLSVSPARQRCTSDVVASPMYGEHSPVVSAF